MSRHTRWLRKQARAKSVKEGQNCGFSSGTAVLDRPESVPVGLGDDGDLPRQEPASSWTATDLVAVDTAGDVAALDQRSSGRETSARRVGPRAALPVLPQSQAVTPSPSSNSLRTGLPAQRRVIRVARGEARLREFDLEGFRFIKPNLATCHLLLNLADDLGSEQAMLDFLREGLAEQGRHSPADLAIYDQEYRRLMRFARQLAAEIDWRGETDQ